MGILGNEAADVLAKNTAEGVPPDDHKKWMSGGGHNIRQWGKRGKKENIEEGKCRRRRRYKESDGMATEGSNQLLPAARRKGHWEGVGKEDRTDRR